MFWTDYTRERRIRGVLRRLSRQRVALILQPGNVWVVEKAIESSPEVEADLSTCYMRGWVEPLANAIPTGQLTAPDRIPAMSERTTLWKLNDSGWYIIRRSQLWVVSGIWISVLSLIAAIAALAVSLMPTGL